MLCDLCGKSEAAIWVQQLAGQNTIELRLCEACARKRGFMNKDGKSDFSVANLLSGLIDGGEKKSEPILPCPKCGMTQSEIRKNGKLGCFECAVRFRVEIRSALRRINAPCEYHGRYPESLLMRETSPLHVDELKIKMREAVNSEDYETAASIRDQLKALDRMEGSK